MFNRTIILSIFSQLLLGILGALILQLVFHPPINRIATVNITEMVDSFVKETAKQKLTPDEMKQRVNQFGIVLNRTLQILANKKHLILLPKEAVITGSPDFTREVSEKVKQGLKS